VALAPPFWPTNQEAFGMSRSPYDRFVFLRGYVTTYAAVAGRSSTVLERALGLGPGSLRAGYAVYELSAYVYSKEFEWKDRTMFSDGWHEDPSINEYVQRFDELRAHYGKRNNWSETATDAQLRRFLALQQSRLNVRVGASRIVKVVTTAPVLSFPDSPLRDIPQWRLTVRKPFRLVANISPGGLFA
jgi:hypothetical protein